MAKTTVDPGDPPLLHAVRSRDERAVDALLAAGAELDASNRFGQTALAWAASEGDVAMVKKLLAAGASADRAGRNGWTPLTLACSEGHVEVAKLLVAAERGPNPARSRALVVAVLRDRPKVIPLLLAHGADDTVRDRDGFTPLMLAAFDGKTALVRLLLRGAKAGESRDAAFLQAAGRGHADTVRVFLEAGVSVDAVSGRGNSALGLARKRRHKEVVALLVAHGAKVAEATTKKRAVPAAPRLADRAMTKPEATMAAGLAATTSTKRRSAAKKIRANESEAFEPVLVAALAREMSDERPWETQCELAHALGACGTEARTARWLEKLAFDCVYSATMVPAALAEAAVRVAGRAGKAGVDALVVRALEGDWPLGQRYALLAGILEGARAAGTQMDPATKKRLQRLLAAAGDEEEEWGPMLARARRAAKT